MWIWVWRVCGFLCLGFLDLVGGFKIFVYGFENFGVWIWEFLVGFGVFLVDGFEVWFVGFGVLGVFGVWDFWCRGFFGVVEVVLKGCKVLRFL